ncbi:MAG: tripartite tricarboxylate transporter substrate binding protein [Betaproteobacteria bacterium]|nr:tripartite tricarboxylate transporter substrate binding protein [Betaproteobacteria bacterium]
MEWRTIWRHTGAALLATAFAFSTQAQAASWPEKPVRVVVPFGTGGGTDIQARLLADNLQKATGQRFVIENRSGAGGLIGAENVVNSPADGHTILFTTATLAINTTLYSKTLKFNPRTDLVASTLVSNAPNVLCVHPSVPARSVKDLLALAKRTPEGLNNGVNTPGSTSHLAAEMLAQLGKIKTVIIPFTGGGPAVIALMTGDIDLLFATGPVAAANLKTGRIRCLAVTTATKNVSFPDLPPINTFVPGLVIGNWYAMFFAKGTPSEAITRLSAVMKQALDDEKIKGFYAREGLEPVGSSPEALRKQFETDVEKYAKVIKTRNIPLR